MSHTPLSPLIHLVDDDEAVRDSLALLIGTVGLRVQTWASPDTFLNGFDRTAIGADTVTCGAGHRHTGRHRAIATQRELPD